MGGGRWIGGWCRLGGFVFRDLLDARRQRWISAGGGG